MKSELPAEGEPAGDRQSAYRACFLGHVHRLLQLGYLAIRNDDYSGTDEETISGDLSEAIEGILDDQSESWMSPYHVHNERPVQQTGRKKKDRTREGKKRQRIDLEFVSTEIAPRVRFSIEAKRLHDSGSVSAYTGPEGMGCFVSAEYAARESAAGMLGFIQERSPEEWLAKIESRIASSRKQLRLRSKQVWRDSEFVVSSTAVKLSVHDRAESRPPIEISHSFLDFRSN